MFSFDLIFLISMFVIRFNDLLIIKPYKFFSLLSNFLNQLLYNKLTMRSFIIIY